MEKTSRRKFLSGLAAMPLVHALPAQPVATGRPRAWKPNGPLGYNPNIIDDYHFGVDYGDLERVSLALCASLPNGRIVVLDVESYPSKPGTVGLSTQMTPKEYASFSELSGITCLL